MLVRCYPGYPMTVQQNGCRIYVAPRIDAYLRQRSIWRHKLAEAHPDRGGSPTRFARLDAQRKAWRAEQAAWFARFDLALPVAALREAGLPERSQWRKTESCRPRGPRRSSSSAPARVQALLEERGRIGIGEAAAVLGLSNMIVSNAISTLRKRGLELVRTPRRGNNHRVVIYMPRSATTKDSAA